MKKNSRYFVGAMTGTSVDGLEVSILQEDSASLSIISHSSIPFPEEIKTTLHTLAENQNVTLAQVGSADILIADFISDAINSALSDANLSPEQISAIGSHGQTIFHQVKTPRFSTQIGNPSVIAERTGIPTVGDIRMADIAAGGEGAPLAPGFHNAVFRSESEHRIILNLGGIANVTFLPRNPETKPLGFDTGPANTLMDRWINKKKHQDLDKDGQWARTGRIVEPVLTRMLEDTYFGAPIPKSTGREHFNLKWLGKILSELPPQEDCDIQRTLLELTAKSIADAIDTHIPHLKLEGFEIYACGGGSYNPFLLERIAACCGADRVKTTADLGIPPEQVEAAAFGWIASRTLDQLPANLPSVTGSKKLKVLGGIYFP